MSGLRLCSQKAERPYHIDELNINIYSIEELAYYLYNNVYFINKDFFNARLTEYIKTELALPEVAAKLEKCIKFGSPYSEFIMIIVRAADYYTDEQIKDLEYTLEKIGDKSVDERILLRAEYFMKNKRYSGAINLYKSIINSKNTRITPDILWQVWTNIGIIYVKRFDYTSAAVRFEKAYSYKSDEQTAEYIVMAYILAGEKDKAAKSANEYGVSDEKLERIRLRIRELKDDIKQSGEYMEFCRSISFSGNINLDEYYAKLQDQIDSWKREYREEMT